MSSLDQALWVLLLGSLLGLELIGKVPPTLHTPLMSGANAISGITVLASLTLIAQANGKHQRLHQRFIQTVLPLTKQFDQSVHSAMRLTGRDTVARVLSQRGKTKAFFFQAHDQRFQHRRCPGLQRRHERSCRFLRRDLHPGGEQPLQYPSPFGRVQHHADSSLIGPARPSADRGRSGAHRCGDARQPRLMPL